VGEEIAPLIVWSDLPDSDLHEIENAVLAAYMIGLREAGWDGDPRLVRCGYAATAVLRYSFSSTLVAVRAALHGREQAVMHNARVAHFLLDLTDEVRRTVR
jgi:hypothetical protein